MLMTVGDCVRRDDRQGFPHLRGNLFSRADTVSLNPVDEVGV